MPAKETAYYTKKICAYCEFPVILTDFAIKIFQCTGVSVNKKELGRTSGLSGPRVTSDLSTQSLSTVSKMYNDF